MASALLDDEFTLFPAICAEELRRTHAYDDVEICDIASNSWKRTWEDRWDWMNMKLPGKDKRERKVAKLKKMVASKRLPPTHAYQLVAQGLVLPEGR